MEEQNERDRAAVRKANEEPDVEAHAKARRLNEDADEAKSDEGESDDTPDVEAHMKANRK